ncbi:hypothetical protein GJ744_006033 [Endocarpon pusillum]|uniref:Uncharacterized protein n=1 Tax=Endocarpon pusillum TaxID=364733 RepID=A0A8H7APK1_9EURO|nr:hypothetical protein GJ744_006033 [Endocarpon pusillum]
MTLLSRNAEEDSHPGYELDGLAKSGITRRDLPYCWTSHLSSLRIGFRGGDSEDYVWLNRFPRYKQYLIQKLLTANVLHLEACPQPEEARVWEKLCTSVPVDRVLFLRGASPQAPPRWDVGVCGARDVRETAQGYFQSHPSRGQEKTESSKSANRPIRS